MSKVVIVDIQTKKSYDDVGGKKNMDQMGVSVAGLYNHDTKKITFYNQEQMPQFIEVLHSSQLVVGINLKRFVYKLLSSMFDNNFSSLNSIDVLEYFKKKLSFKPTLEGLFRGTLDISKSLPNDNYVPRLYKEGKLEEIHAICEDNITDLIKFYDFGKEKGYIFYEDKTGQRWKISVKW
ncbi:hypothetical protein GF337_04725 [candidate division KSB1 bacterium]|nr:hypothetical protein [candidate division KSB1 bacterium]